MLFFSFILQLVFSEYYFSVLFLFLLPFFPLLGKTNSILIKNISKSLPSSTLAQGKRAGLITLRSVDRNYEALSFFFFFSITPTFQFQFQFPILFILSLTKNQNQLRIQLIHLS